MTVTACGLILNFQQLENIMSKFNQAFATEHGLSVNSVNNFARLGRKYAKERTHALNGDPFNAAVFRDKNHNAKLWADAADSTAERMENIVKKWGFDHLDFGVGLYPTIQRDKSDTHGTIHFQYGVR